MAAPLPTSGETEKNEHHNERRKAEDGSSDRQPAFKRRESDRTGVEGGIRSGGRRASDRRAVGTHSKPAKIAIGVSFAFSFLVIFWAFTLPFRSGTSPEKLGNATTVGLDQSDPTARMTNTQFVESMLAVEDSLQRRMKAKYVVERNPKDLKDVQRKWERSTKRQQKTLELVMSDVEEVDKLDEKSLEWQTREQIEAVLKDAPPEKYRRRYSSE